MGSSATPEVAKFAQFLRRKYGRHATVQSGHPVAVQTSAEGARPSGNQTPLLAAAVIAGALTGASFPGPAAGLGSTASARSSSRYIDRVHSPLSHVTSRAD